MRIERIAGLSTGPDFGTRGHGAVVTVGNFDGVHRGHRGGLFLAGSEAAARGADLVAVTFDPHPARLLRPGAAPLAIQTLEQKAEQLASAGVDRLLVLEFNEELARISPRAFVERLLVRRLRVRAMVQGRNFRFGHGRSGDLACLRRLGAESGFDVIEAPTEIVAGEVVSSTRIRRAVADRDLELARAMLGRPYQVEGVVVAGRGRGRGLGFPTANLIPAGDVLLPHGVYAADAEILSTPGPRRYRAVVHHGPRPTFEDHESLEAHLVGFSGEISALRLTPDRFLRPVRAFPGPDALRRQLARDVSEATGAPLLELAVNAATVSS